MANDRKKKILVGISGGIAIYKVAQLVSNLAKKHEVQVVMSEHATELMSPLTFETLTERPVVTKMFGPEIKHDKVPHIELAKWADLIILAPATANLVAKMAHGIADDMLSTMLLAARSPILVAPAMNTYMLNHPATVENLNTLLSRGIEIMDTEVGMLACQDFGSGKLASPEAIQERAEEMLQRHYGTREVSGDGAGDVRSGDGAGDVRSGDGEISNGGGFGQRRDLAGVRVTVTAGPTEEALDPVRFVTNHSSGKMGYAVAEAARERGADVLLISGPVHLEEPEGVEVRRVTSALEMYEEVRAALAETDILIKAAAVSDYRPAEVSEEKIKKGQGDLVVRFVRNPDILAWAGENKRPGTILAGFAMETEDLLTNAKHKLETKHLDLVVANSLKVQGAGFGVDTNVATLIWPDREEALPLMAKSELAGRILDECVKLYRANEADA